MTDQLPKKKSCSASGINAPFLLFGSSCRGGRKNDTGPASSVPARRFLSAEPAKSIVIFVRRHGHQTRCLFERRRVNEEDDEERRGRGGHVLQCDGPSMLSCVGSQRRRLRDAAHMKAPSVRPPCTQICMSLVIFGLEEPRSNFWDGGKDALSHPPPPSIRYPFLITHLENVTCVNSSRANIVKYLILKLKPDVNIIKRSKCVICSVCVSVPVSQGKSLYYLNANKDHLETQRSAIFIKAGE